MISIHAPARGATPDQRRGRDHHEDFNPRPREGGDTKTGSCAGNPADFNPRPREGGERRRVRIPQALCDISIHAPREGGDVSALNKKPTIALFQSTPPARGATKKAHYHVLWRYISIHAPREGGDASARAEARRECISIHAPREGGDTPKLSPTDLGVYFNPRPPRGGRPAIVVQTSPT